MEQADCSRMQTTHKQVMDASIENLGGFMWMRGPA